MCLIAAITRVITMPTNTSERLRRLTLAAILCVLVFVATTYTRIPIWVSGSGYIHLGDSFIYLAAAILPLPYACAVGAIGAGIADLIGYPIFTPGTVIIKILIVLFFTSKQPKLACSRNIIAPVFAAAVTIVGYYFYEVLLVKNFAAPLVSIPFNLVQAAAGAIVFYILALMFDKLSLKSKILK